MSPSPEPQPDGHASPEPSVRPAPTAEPEAGRPGWPWLLFAYWITSVVEGLGVSQVFAFLPAYLQSMGLSKEDSLPWVGIFSALVFLVGLPLVPLWGVWADRFSRKAVIVRSSLVEAVVFALVALSREPWQLGASLLLVGLQLGNTGVMLAALRDAGPRQRIGTILALFGSSSPIGFAAGPIVGGVVVDGLGWGLPAVFAISAGLSLGTAFLVGLGTPEIRPPVIPQGRTLQLAFGYLRGVLTDPPTRRIFAIFFLAFLANQMARPYIPVLVQDVNGPDDLATAIGLVVGVAALAGALIAPLGGWLGDRLGYQRVLVATLAGAALAGLALPAAPDVPSLALVALVSAALYAVVAPMVFALLATEVSVERRSQTLNLVYLPLYMGGIIGPILAGAVVGLAVAVPFILGALVYLVGALAVALVRGWGAQPDLVPDRPSD
ncbi:MAG TPA: MFS transporter [Candidatus Limnocylindrales bacterium]|nr:MFS transporter [Candidatus Limnocylindrales bacterium]